MRRVFLTLVFCFSFVLGHSYSILIPMDGSQKNHLKAYGIAFFALQEGISVDWLLNYRGGSFLIPYSVLVESECLVRGISVELLNDVATNSVLQEIASPAVNMNVVKLETAPRIAVYSIKNELVADETDAVITVLDYAEIPYTLLYDDEVLEEDLVKYDWLHLHHEDFTGQYWRFRWRLSAIIESEMQEATAARLGYATVSAMKLQVAKKIKEFCAGGGYLFAMCSAAETFDIALAAEGIEISEATYDVDEESNTQGKLDFNKTLAFENFTLENENRRRFSDINTGRPDFFDQTSYYFQLFDFSAKWDIVPVMLTQDHEHVIKEFTGQTTSFNKYVVKSEALVLGENKKGNSVRYIYGELGRGHWTFYSGHDPEGSPGRRRGTTDLNLYPNSPGYRLILNNVLFPSAKRKKQKT
ncbi:MAG: asparagine synthetase B [Cyclobacteriaceae bacterium]|nr:asparagine synthetase B [Cyclobacteriaceae bacterium]MDH4295692.1 asparagine synthetase B [Cyclobacteriaceae bacterium]MDH5248286.1 asparagine synthetase B [Cyclobacteriaceae bacterium]